MFFAFLFRAILYFYPMNASNHSHGEDIKMYQDKMEKKPKQNIANFSGNLLILKKVFEIVLMNVLFLQIPFPKLVMLQLQYKMIQDFSCALFAIVNFLD